MSIDDVPAIHKALSECGDGGTIIIPANETFMIRSPLNFNNCRACDFQIEGTLKLSDDNLDFWEDKVALSIENVSGAIFHSLTGSGLIDGNGQKYWDYFAVNKTVTDLILNATSTSSSEPINTDGIDTNGSSHVTISNIHIINDDDCVCFKTGSNYIRVDNVTCVGSRGISVGSLGNAPGYYTVNNVYASNVKMINNTQVARIKVFGGGPSYGNVSVCNVTVDNCDFAFRIETCYDTSADICKQYPSTATFSNITLINFTGITSKKYHPAVANIDCSLKGTCDLTFQGWNVLSPSKNNTVLCANYDNPIGVKCTPGAFG